jgi:hypothetical protein
MNRKEYIRSRFEKILSESLDTKVNEIMTKLNYDEEVPFHAAPGESDYVQEGEKQVCDECNGMMVEGECSECGWKGQGEVMELGGMDTDHPRFGKLNLKKLSKDELEALLHGDDEDEMSSDDDDEWEEIDLDTETDWDQLEEELHGGQHKLDKNKNGRLDGEDFKMLRKQKNEEQLYEVEFEKNEFNEGSKPDFLDLDNDGNKKESMKSAAKSKEMKEKWEGDVEVKHTGEYEDMSIEELNAAIKKQKDKNDKVKESGKKVSHADKTKMSQLYFAKRAKQGWKGKGKAKVTESLIFTENELISLIEKMVNEEKNSFKMKEPKGYVEYDKAHKKDKKENEDYLKSVAKKMTDYLKGASDDGSKYEMKETQKFPTENGGKRKKYTPSDAVEEYIDAFSYPGQTNLVYDEIKPNDEWIEANLKGSSKTGNAQVDKDGNALGNVVPSEVGEKFYKNFKDNLYGQEQMDASYKRQPQPVDQAGEETERGSLKSKRGKKTSQSVLNKLDEGVNEKETMKLNEEFNRIQNLMGYNRKTQ